MDEGRESAHGRAGSTASLWFLECSPLVPREPLARQPERSGQTGDQPALLIKFSADFGRDAERRIQVPFRVGFGHVDAGVTQDDLRGVQAGLLANSGCSRVPQSVWTPGLDSGLFARPVDHVVVGTNR